jgi:hypothetical protein
MTDARAIDREPVPAEIDRWTWGAFLLNWIWGVGNNTLIALLMFVPLVGLVMPFVLGARGSRWAWRNGRWDGIEHFKHVQWKWAIWGFVIVSRSKSAGATSVIDLLRPSMAELRGRGRG